MVWHIHINISKLYNIMKNLSERNRKVAMSRWSRVHKKEKINISRGPESYSLMARLCGFLAGDGSIMIRKDNKEKFHYVLRFFPDHESLIKPFIHSLVSVYNKKPIIKKDFRNQGLICYSKVVVQDLLSKAKFGVLKWEVPFDILKDRNSKIEWLRAFFDSECYVGKDHIKIQTVSKNGMIGVQKLLLEFGIKSRNYVYQPKNKNYHKVFILVIGPKLERLKFLNIIGLNHKIKLSKLNQLLGSPNLVWHRS